MSLFGTLNTAVSGMAAQANMLGTIGDNIANSATTGYKSAGVQFETLLGNQSNSFYQSGGVQTRVRYGIADQGSIIGTSTVTDLAVNGSGFFVVQSPSGTPVLTRAGDFVPDSNGNLVNAAGYKLMAYNLTDGSQVSANGVGGLELVNINNSALTSAPSTKGVLSVNLPSNDAIAATPASNNATGVNFSGKAALTTYDNLGNPVQLDIYFSKVSDDGTTATWEASVYNHADADPTSGNFPYTSGPIGGANTLTFSDANGALTSTGTLDINIPNGSQPMTLDISKMTQLATAFGIDTATVDGNAPSKLDHIAISNDGTLTSIYKNGAQKASYQIPLATVPSPNNLTPLSGNVYEASLDSGEIIVGVANSGPFGAIDSSSLEQSTVDIATELTNMITAQRSYEANSKVIQTSSDLLSVITNLK